MPRRGTLAACCAAGASPAHAKPSATTPRILAILSIIRLLRPSAPIGPLPHCGMRNSSQPRHPPASQRPCSPAPQRPRSSFDHLVRADHNGRREGETQGLGGFHIDHKLEPHGLFHRQGPPPCPLLG